MLVAEVAIGNGDYIPVNNCNDMEEKVVEGEIG